MPGVSPRRSPEIEAVLLRFLRLLGENDRTDIERLIGKGPAFRAIGTDPDEWWDTESFLPVIIAQGVETGDAELDVLHVEGWELDSVAWAAVRVVVTHPSLGVSVEMRITAVFVLDGGIWQIIQWHASEGVPNEATLGIALTTTLAEMLEAIDIERDFSAFASEGVLTLMFTDVAGSTGHAQALGDRTYSDLMAGHVRLVSDVAALQGGEVIKTTGDGAFVVFTSARAAVSTAVAIQRRTTDLGVPYEVRIGLHAGEVVRRDSDVMGLAVNKAARVTSAAAGGQIMMSSVVRDLVGSDPSYRIGDSFVAELRGLDGLHELIPVEWRVGAEAP